MVNMSQLMRSLGIWVAKVLAYVTLTLLILFGISWLGIYDQLTSLLANFFSESVVKLLVTVLAASVAYWVASRVFDRSVRIPLPSPTRILAERKRVSSGLTDLESQAQVPQRSIAASALLYCFLGANVFVLAVGGWLAGNWPESSEELKSFAMTSNVGIWPWGNFIPSMRFPEVYFPEVASHFLPAVLTFQALCWWTVFLSALCALAIPFIVRERAHALSQFRAQWMPSGAVLQSVRLPSAGKGALIALVPLVISVASALLLVYGPSSLDLTGSGANTVFMFALSTFITDVFLLLGATVIVVSV
jgi:hypothetical protein